MGKCSEILAALSYSVNPRVNKDMMMMMMMTKTKKRFHFAMVSGANQHIEHYLKDFPEAFNSNTNW